ncbi:FAD-dependent oxidoreductase [Actinoplanes sp. NPDC000266]
MGDRAGTVIVGGGAAGLAAAWHLRRRGRPFVVLDAAAHVGDAWRQRYDCLRLFTPARFCGLPGMPMALDPAAHPTRVEMADYSEYHRPSDLPPGPGPGPVLVIGAGTAGAGLALDLAASREVWLSGRPTGRSGRVGGRRTAGVFRPPFRVWGSPGCPGRTRSVRAFSVACPATPPTSWYGSRHAHE